MIFIPQENAAQALLFDDKLGWYDHPAHWLGVKAICTLTDATHGCDTMLLWWCRGWRWASNHKNEQHPTAALPEPKATAQINDDLFLIWIMLCLNDCCLFLKKTLHKHFFLMTSWDDTITQHIPQAQLGWSNRPSRIWQLLKHRKHSIHSSHCSHF